MEGDVQNPLPAEAKCHMGMPRSWEHTILDMLRVHRDVMLALPRYTLATLSLCVL